MIYSTAATSIDGEVYTWEAWHEGSLFFSKSGPRVIDKSLVSLESLQLFFRAPKGIHTWPCAVSLLHSTSPVAGIQHELPSKLLLLHFLVTPKSQQAKCYLWNNSELDGGPRQAWTAKKITSKKHLFLWPPASATAPSFFCWRVGVGGGWQFALFTSIHCSRGLPFILTSHSKHSVICFCCYCYDRATRFKLFLSGCARNSNLI